MRMSPPPIERRREGAGGFLLTETLATFTISAFVLLGLVSASSVLLRNVDGDVAHIEAVDDLSFTMKAIQRDISGLVRARWNGYEPQAFVFRGGPNSLYFAHAERDADGLRETSVVALREIIAGRTTRLMMGEAHLAAGARGFADLHYRPQRELGTGDARLRFSYEKPAEKKTGAVLLRNWETEAVLPAAIIVEAVARDSGRSILSMRVPIQSNADIGCLEHDESSADDAPPPPGSMAALDAALAKSSAVASEADEPRSFCGRETRRDLRKAGNDPGQVPITPSRPVP